MRMEARRAGHTPQETARATTTSKAVFGNLSRRAKYQLWEAAGRLIFSLTCRGLLMEAVTVRERARSKAPAHFYLTLGPSLTRKGIG